MAETDFAVGYDESGPRYAFAVAGPLEWLEARVSSFRWRIAAVFALVGLGLVAVSLFQVQFALRPLRAIGRGLAAIRSGDAQRLEGDLPAEIEPLQVELNALIQSNQDIVDRARTQVGNLAHALKTPLAVIINESRGEDGPLGAKVAHHAEIMRDQVNHYLERARMVARAGAIGRVTDVEPAVQALKRTLEQIYRDKGVTVAVECPPEARFQGEKQDLEEMLGNLLDNACKWANAETHVVVTLPLPARGMRPRLVITVDDDGPGLTDEQRTKIGKRGMRLDESKPGTGLGLSIVTDLATSYGGKLTLDRAAAGGLRVSLDLPAA
jgi:signal transduction histidine kinase